LDKNLLSFKNLTGLIIQKLNMELIKKPVEIDFTVISKVWTDEDEKEFSELIKKQKENRNKKQIHLSHRLHTEHA